MRPESELRGEGELANTRINESQEFTYYRDNFKWLLKWDNKTQTEKENTHKTLLLHAITQSLKIRRRSSTENTAQNEHTSMGAGRWHSTRQCIRESTSFNNWKGEIIYPVKNSSSASHSDEGCSNILTPVWGKLFLQWGSVKHKFMEVTLSSGTETLVAIWTSTEKLRLLEVVSKTDFHMLRV